MKIINEKFLNYIEHILPPVQKREFGLHQSLVVKRT